MELRRTVPVKLTVDSEQAALLHETIEQFLWAALRDAGHSVALLDADLRMPNMV